MIFLKIILVFIRRHIKCSAFLKNREEILKLYMIFLKIILVFIRCHIKSSAFWENREYIFFNFKWFSWKLFSFSLGVILKVLHFGKIVKK